MTQPTGEDLAFPNKGDTRPQGTDPRRTPDDNRFGYGSSDYLEGEGNDEAVTGEDREMPEAEPSEVPEPFRSVRVTELPCRQYANGVRF